MCGILGSWGQTDKTIFKKGLDAIAHRGPDGFGIYETGDMTLGHRRLAIIDLSDNGKQPMKYGRFTITFNGEIYNFVELKKELQQKEIPLKTESDTEVLLAAYMVWGHNCLHKLNGQWAFAIWDEEKRELFLSRDRFGKKPLFYAQTKDAFVFGSEMKSITPFLKEVKPSEDFEWCYRHIMEYEATDKCLIDGIKRFPAGSYAVLNNPHEQIKPVKFWETKNNLVQVPADYEKQVKEFREIFIDACAIRMRSDVPVGTALSGGLDSSAIMCTLAHITKTKNVERVAKSNQHAFVACFEDSLLDERDFAEQVVNHINVPATYLDINPVAGIDKLADYLYMFEELYLTSPVPMMEIYKAIRNNGVIVSIDGHGADELMGGYHNQVTKALVDAGLNYKSAKSVLSAYNGMIDKKHVNENIPGTGIKEWYRQMNLHLKGRKNLARYLVNSLTAVNKKEKPGKGIYGAYNETLYELYHHTVLPTLLRNYDRYSMASGVEIRMPFLDYRLAQYCFSLPWQSKIRNGYTKALIRDAARPFMPEEITNRKSKIGFNTPIVEWIKGPWKEFFLDHLNSTGFSNCNLVNQKLTRQVFNDVISNPKAKFGEGEYAWYLITPYLWEQSFVKRK